MTYRIEEIEVPSDSPFKNDALDRKQVVEFLTKLIERLSGPFVLAIDSPWGTGKTTLVKMLAADLQGKKFKCIHFNAWKIDYINDPLIALVSSVDEIGLDNSTINSKFRDGIEKVKKIANILAKRSLIVGAKVATLGVIDAEKDVEAAIAEMTGNSAADLFDSFVKEKKLLEQFRDHLGEATSLLSHADHKENLIFFIDELDRCRPTFAIELLERIKHLFDVPNIIFVLSIDKKQLESIIRTVYGQGIDAPEYLRRFIDLEMGIPAVHSEQFTQNLMSRFDLDSVFSERTGSEIAYDKSQFIEYFTTLADSFELTLRARERCLTRLKVVMDQTPPNHYLHPVLVSLLIILRVKQLEIFNKVVSGEYSPAETMEYIRERMKGKISPENRMPLIIEAYLIISDPNIERKQERMESLNGKFAIENQDNRHQQRNTDLHAIINSINAKMRYGGISISKIAKKIDLAAMMRE